MSRRTKVLLALVVIVGLVALWVYVKPFQRVPYDPEAFSVADTSEIQKIVLADKQGRVVVLSRSDKGWLVNDKWIAQPENVRLLLTTLMKQRVKFPAPVPARENILREMEVSAVRVDVYGEDEEPMLPFYIGPATPDNMATYMLRVGDTLPYAVHLPGHIGVLNPRYHTEAQEWRRKVLIALRPEQIRMVEVRYPQFKEPGFRLYHNNGNFELEPIDYPPIADSVSTRVLRFYLNQFGKLGVLGFVDNRRLIDSILRQPVYATLMVVTQQDTIRLRFYLHGIDERSKVPFDPQTGKPLKYDRDRLWVYDPESGELMLGQWFVWGRVLRYYTELIGSRMRLYREAPEITE